MSDLQCAATIIVARHGEAEYDAEGLSDDGGSLTLAGREQARALGESLIDRKVAAIWCSDMARAVQTAEIAAERSGLHRQSTGGVAGVRCRRLGWIVLRRHAISSRCLNSGSKATSRSGPPGAETGADVVRRMTVELEDLADQYRGETTLVITHGGVMTMALPMMASNVSDTFAWGQAVRQLRDE